MTESNRMWASASFVGVLIVIGLPLWWKTTEVYRVSLPYDKIDSFDTLSHSITTELTVLANDEATASEIVGLIEKAFEESDVIKLKITKSILSKQLHSTLDSVADEAEAVEEVAAAYDLNKHNSFYVVQRKPLFQDTWLAGERVMFFRDAKASKTVVEALKRVVYQTSVVEGAKSESADAARQTRFPPGGGYHIVLSVVHPRPDALTVELDAGEAVEDYIGSFVDELSVLHNFTLKSQWLHLLDFDFQAKEVRDTSDFGRHFAVRQDRLHLLLTKLEERMATHVSELPTINLALYAVPCERAPLVIYDNNARTTHESELPTINLALYAVPCERAPLVIYDNNEESELATVNLALYAVPCERAPLVIYDNNARTTHESELPTINLALYAVPCERAPLVIYDNNARTTHESELPTINLALYAVPCERAPLVIYDNNEESELATINLALYAVPCERAPLVIYDNNEESELATINLALYAVPCERAPLVIYDNNEESELATINLALYAVPCERAPLVIYDNNDQKVQSHVQAFMSPKWGGVVLGGPSEPDCRDARVTWKPNVRVVMGTFISQLRKLLGITDAEHIDGGHLEPLRSVTPRQWEIDNLLRIRTLEQLTSAERTLQSLAQLLGEISNIVINDEVGASINSAVDSIQQASALMAQGKLVEAYKMSQSAFLAAETAFMEPSLLALLYFPDDQKYAIYIPLFLPIMFPVVLSLKNLLLWFRGKPIHKEKMD
ncbi:hypothetical protein PYW07_008471 [Mythimna separata]|uniref:GPI transamidase component PIG-S n=1 Tax=Mythimna separata TaxID=271217 RepID=A0AAD8DP22_MYTSE|nr:hypothetical protein PYW07_008471 [Mythimna separata]